MAVASVDTLSVALAPAYWDLFVNFVHPCHFAVFSDHIGVTSPIVAEVEEAPHPTPIYEIAPDFPYDLEGLYDCGPQSISIVDHVLPVGTLSDFISISKVGDVWTLDVSPTNPL